MLRLKECVLVAVWVMMMQSMVLVGGVYGNTMCDSAVETSCADNPNQAFCKFQQPDGKYGMIYDVVNETSGEELKNQNLYQVFCSPYLEDVPTTNLKLSALGVSTTWSTSGTDQGNTFGSLRGGCSSGYYCPKSDSIPKLCGYNTSAPNSNEDFSYGYYCETPETMTDCPEGSFCSMASHAPKECSAMEICPENSEYTLPLIGLVAVGIISFVLVAVFVCTRKIEARNTKVIVNSCIIGEKHGKAVTRVSSKLKPAEASLDVYFEEIGLTLGKDESLLSKMNVFKKKTDMSTGGKVIMEGVTGHFPLGKVTAVMGPSGAGKSTLLSLISGKVERTSGKIFVNGAEEELSKFQKIIGFVPQEDVMLRMLTVEEILTHSANVRLPSSWTSEEKQEQVDAVIDVLGLSHVRRSIIGNEEQRGISGGQAKRVNIGIELVANPAVLFLDEPTSGLDSASSQSVISYLDKVASQGRTIVTVIHQPRYEIFELFNNVLLLAKGGRSVYEGAATGLTAYMQSIGFTCPDDTNPADFFMDAISGRVLRDDGVCVDKDIFVQNWLERKQSPEECKPKKVEALDSCDDISVAISPVTVYPEDGEHIRKTAGWLKQFVLFVKRTLIQQYRETSIITIFIIIHLICAVALGFNFISHPSLYIPPMPSFMAKYCPPAISSYCNEVPLTRVGLNNIAFFTCFVVGVAAVVTSTHVFGDEKPQYWRDASTGMSRSAYFVAKSVMDTPWILLGSLLFSSIFFIMVHIPKPFSTTFPIIFCIEFAAWGIGYVVSVFVKKDMAQSIGVLLVFACAVFSGISPKYADVKSNLSVLRVFWAVSYARYGSEAMYISTADYYRDSSFPVDNDLNNIGYDANNYNYDLVCMIALGLGFRIFAYLGLIFKDRHKQK
eukprot:Nk52_evm15s284 gene=Nk52_evmTU15s284